MRNTTVSVGPLVAASANNIALSQSPTTTFTLSGSTGGTLDTPRRVLFTQASSESGKTYTIVGTTWGGAAQTEVLAAAASATTVQSNLDFLTVTSITISSASAGAITVGTNGVASSRWVYLSDWAGGALAVQNDATGTVNYTVQTTMQDPTSPTNAVLPYNVVWVSSANTDMVGATADTGAQISTLVAWARVLLNSGTGSVSTVFSQEETGGPGGSGAGGGGTDQDVNLVGINGTAPVTAGVNGLLAVGGPTASGATATGNPVRIGGVYNSTLPTYTNGQQGDLQQSAKGALYAALIDPSNGSVVTVTGQNSATLATGSVGVSTTSFGRVYNATAWDLLRSPVAASNSQGTGAQAVGLPLWSTTDLTGVRINVAASGDTALVAAVSGQTTRVYRYFISVAAAVIVQIKTGSTVVAVFNFGGNGGAATFDLSDRPYAKTAANEALNINLSANVQVDGRLEYVTSA